MPDAIMYGCLMRVFAQFGRTELSQELSRLAPQLDTQNYMSLIRAAGHDKGAERAFQLLEKLKGAGDKMDLAMYNFVLDACLWQATSPGQRAHDDHARKAGSIKLRALQPCTERPYLGGRDSRCLHVAQSDGVGRHHTENSFGKVPGVVIEALAKNCTAFTTVYVDSCGKATDVGIEALAKNGPSWTNVVLSSCGKVTDVGIEALAKNCTSLTTIYLDRCAWARMRASRPLPRTAHP